jgi:hypothetical protein
MVSVAPAGRWSKDEGDEPGLAFDWVADEEVVGVKGGRTCSNRLTGVLFMKQLPVDKRGQIVGIDCARQAWSCQKKNRLPKSSIL